MQKYDFWSILTQEKRVLIATNTDWNDDTIKRIRKNMWIAINWYNYTSYPPIWTYAINVWKNKTYKSIMIAFITLTLILVRHSKEYRFLFPRK